MHSSRLIQRLFSAKIRILSAQMLDISTGMMYNVYITWVVTTTLKEISKMEKQIYKVIYGDDRDEWTIVCLGKTNALQNYNEINKSKNSLGYRQYPKVYMDLIREAKDEKPEEIYKNSDNESKPLKEIVHQCDEEIEILPTFSTDQNIYIFYGNKFYQLWD